MPCFLKNVIRSNHLTHFQQCHSLFSLGAPCKRGYDPCSDHTCRHNGTCVVIGEHGNFAECRNCSSGWAGSLCDDEVTACELAEARLGRPPCENHGHCVNRNTSTSRYSCLCEAGWQGSQCETSFSKVSGEISMAPIPPTKFKQTPITISWVLLTRHDLACASWRRWVCR